MLYRPNYCCQCGEKILRARWTPLTSRRFCEFCEVEQKQHELLPKAMILIAFLVGAAGLTAYIGGTGEPSNSRVSRETMVRIGDVRAGPNNKPVSLANTVNSSSNDSAFSNPVVAPSNASMPNSKQREVTQDSSTEPVYYCGAITKKGTPCTRRVKVKGRCWQHVGQTAVRGKRD